MPRTLAAAVLTLGLLPLAAAGGDAAAPAKAPDGKAAFERLKTLAGVWEGHAMTPDGPPATVSYELVSNGHTVLQRQFAGTPHEMVTMYHLEGGDLVAVHYCSAGNQPRMKYAPAASSADDLAFDFAGGAGIDPARDMHVRGARLSIKEGGRLEEEWAFWAGGKPTEKAKLFLTRKK